MPTRSTSTSSSRLSASSGGASKVANPLTYSGSSHQNIEAVRIVDMSGSNSWVEFAAQHPASLSGS